MNPPDNLPQLPPVPPGFDRWEYHPPGSGWKSDTPRVWAAILTGMTEWQLNDSPETACGTNSLHYIEAVREPASTRKESAMSDRPTPETDDASFSTVIQGELVKASLARRLERQRDESSAIIAATLKALPVGYLPAHTPESIPERVADLVARYAEVERKVDEAREALHQIAQLKSMSMISRPWDEITRLAEIAMSALARIDEKGGNRE